ncbi:MAG: ATP synthase F1 subunit delta, partial [Holosporaceae bacterium]|nr:ATP synthase F1 subunit delta [Holosporaceae bacterium]
SLIAQKGFLLIDKIKTELELSNEMVAFLNLLQKNKRLSLLIEICDSYASLVDRIKGKKSVYITYAKKLSKRDETKLVNNIRKIFKGQIECVTKKDESIIGSIKVQYRSKILDYSVKSRLTRLNNAIRKGHYEN